MKIYIDDGFAIQHGGGIGVYAQILCNELKNRGHEVTHSNYGILKKVKSAVVRRIFYSLYLSFIMPFYLSKNRYDIAHFTNLQAPIIKNRFTKYIATVHDLSPILFPETVPVIYTKLFRFNINNTINKSDKIITVSESVKNELQHLFNLSETFVQVCYSNLRDIFLNNKVIKQNVLNRLAVKAKDYFLFVGRLERRKNLRTLAHGFDHFKLETKSTKKLVLVGAKGFGYDEIFNSILSCRFKNDIIMTGYIPDEELKGLYQNASAVIFPSIYEGFGLPLFEAMVFNLPLIVSRIPTNLEILDSRGYFFDKDNVHELTQLLKTFENSKNGAVDYSDILNKYSLDKMIDLHLEAYESVLMAKAKEA